MDESSDDLGTVQIPTSWRPAFLDFSTVQLFFDLYASLPASLSPVVSQQFIVFRLILERVKIYVSGLVHTSRVHCSYK